MSVHPVMAALAGLVVLGQELDGLDWAAIGAVVAANAVSALTSGRARRSLPRRGTAHGTTRLARGNPTAGA
ncbi:hypothetical protein [Nocardiopsis sp. CNS-639]|nr:hypothetical protein [Nocardiopsis sp. CNS-639]